MLYSLRFGILVAMFAIASVAIVTISIFAGLTTRAEFTRYVEYGRELREERIQRVVLMFADNQDDEPIAENAVNSNEYRRDRLFEALLSEADNFRFTPLGVVGTFEELSGVSISGDESLRFEIEPDGTATIYRDDEPIGTLYIDPVSELDLLPAQNDFLETINWTLLLAALMTGLAAIALTVILSRRILNPVAALTLAARLMESGDFTQRVMVHSEGEIAELAQAFNAMADTLKRNEDLRRSMVSDIAHELRRPLTNIRGYLEGLHDGVVSPDRETLNLLYEEAITLQQLVQDLQELALAEAGQLRLAIQPLSLNEAILQGISALKRVADHKQIALSAELPPSLPDVLADERRVAQILRNLVNNALIHTPPDGEVSISAAVLSSEVAISVKDTGEGIDSEYLPFIFERFYRADPSRSRATGGAGLGLAIVKNLVEAQGGHVQVESIKGKGSTFSFTVPRYVPEN